MKLIRPLDLGHGRRVFEHARRFYLSIGAYLCFDLDQPDAPPQLEQVMWPVIQETLGEGIFDLALPKPRGEVLVHGFAYAPAGRAVQACRVGLRCGPVAKELSVFGDRVWRDGEIGDPTPFQRMPLDYAHAYGGPDWPRNPLGKGRAAVATPEGETPRPLPNVEDPEALIAFAADTPEPAGFAGLDLGWPQRRDLLGTYGAEWFTDHFPGFAADLDWEAFQAAPGDQRLPGFLEGGESFELTGMHPERPALRGTLPRRRARCFLLDRTDQGELLREAPMRLETVWFFPHALRGVLGFRTMLEIRDEDADHLPALMLAHESLASPPRPLDFYIEAFGKTRDPRNHWPDLAIEADLVPAGEAPPLQRMIEAGGQTVTAEDFEPTLIDEDQTAPSGAMPSGSGAGSAAGAGLAMLRPDLVAACAPLGMNAESILARLESTVPPGAPLDPQALVQALRAQGIADAALEARIDSLISAAPVVPGGAREPGVGASAGTASAVPLCSGEEGSRLRARVQGNHADGCGCPEEELMGAPLGGLDLAGIDLHGANLAGAHLAGSDLRGANLAGANLEGAILDEACFDEANLEGASLAGSSARRATFRRANLRGASLAESCLREAVLEGAVLLEADWAGADLVGAGLQGAAAPLAVLDGLDCTNTNWTGADLRRATFLACTLDGAILDRIQGEAMTFAGGSGRGLMLRGADLSKALVQEGTTMLEADASGACWIGAGIGGARLDGIRLDGARLDGLNAIGARMRGASLTNADAPGASFRKADLEGANLAGIDLREGSLHGARLVATNLAGANLHAADLARATYGETVFDGALLERTILKDWQPA